MIKVFVDVLFQYNIISIALRDLLLAVSLFYTNGGLAILGA